MKVITILGARPQFVKASAISREFKKYLDIEEVLIHTGQHFDKNMSSIFFDQMDIPKPKYNLEISSMGHGAMTGLMLIEIEKLLISEQPDYVLVYGDTNSTLAGALAAAKLHIPIAHVEAGLRSFNMRMPEEVNRILTDQISTLLFCPTGIAIENLKNEGFDAKDVDLLNVGDVMQDSAIYYSSKSTKPKDVKSNTEFVLATLHRAENTDTSENLESIVKALNFIHKNGQRVILPLHPRTKSALERYGLELSIDIIEPVGYMEMLWLLKNCALVLTDSGGVQKEAYFFNKFCVTMREQTEWLELVENNLNVLVGSSQEKIIEAVKMYYGKTIIDSLNLYGGGHASEKIVAHLVQNFNEARSLKAGSLT